MSEETNTETQNLDFDDLDAFSSSFFGEKSEDNSKADDANSDDAVTEADTETDGEEEVTTEGDGDDTQEAEEDDSDDSENEDAAEEPVDEKPKKGGRFQERINELTTARREAERREQDAINRIAALEARLSNPQNKDTTDTTADKVDEPSAPTPTDKNADGSDKYELGEFDPQFVRDLSKFSVAEALRESQIKSEQSRAQQTQTEAAQALEREWNAKLAPAQERYPDYESKAKSLEPIFTSVDPAYGDYLGQTIMSMDHGPDVLYYLAEHPEEAAAIINSGATKATIQLGRLESRFIAEQEQPQPKEKRVTKAPTPPAHVNKGSAGARPSVPDDTDDLDAFAEKFFKRK